MTLKGKKIASRGNNENINLPEPMSNIYSEDCLIVAVAAIAVQFTISYKPIVSVNAALWTDAQDPVLRPWIQSAEA